MKTTDKSYKSYNRYHHIESIEELCKIVEEQDREIEFTQESIFNIPEIYNMRGFKEFQNPVSIEKMLRERLMFNNIVMFETYSGNYTYMFLTQKNLRYKKIDDANYSLTNELNILRSQFIQLRHILYTKFQLFCFGMAYLPLIIYIIYALFRYGN